MVERQAKIMRYCQLDRVCVEDASEEVPGFMVLADFIQRCNDAHLRLKKGFTFRMPGPRGCLLDNFPVFCERQSADGLSLPLAYV